jgi:transcriptional regulator with XRE-family HTH domain
VKSRLVVLPIDRAIRVIRQDPRVDWIRFGRSIRALRKRRGWRQKDLAAAAGVSQSVVARIELGRGDRVAPWILEQVARALSARAVIRLDWNGEALDRLLDAGHAALVERVASMLRAAGWEVAAEVTFWIRGERGSVDLLGWHPATRVLLVIEVKSVVPDLQATLGSFDRKARLGREIGLTRDWDPVAVGRLLVIGESRTARRRVLAHSTIFDAELPDRFAVVRRFLANPTPASAVRGLMFLPGSSQATTRHRQPRPKRSA